jgi:hypothetical protein
VTSADRLLAAPREEKILAKPFQGAAVFVVVVGSLLILQSIILRLLLVPKIRNRDGVRDPLHALYTWIPCLTGGCVLMSNLPRMVGAPHALLMICDSLGGLLALTSSVWALRLAHRAWVRRPRPGATT